MLIRDWRARPGDGHTVITGIAEDGQAEQILAHRFERMIGRLFAVDQHGVSHELVPGFAPRPDQMTISPFNVRTNAEDTSDLAALPASIREQGVLEPIIVHTLPDGSFGAVAGGRRTRSVRALVERGELPADWPVNVILRDDLTPAQLIGLSLTENMQRRDLRDYEVFAGVAQQHALGMTIAQIAQEHGQRQEWAEQAIRLGNLAEPIFVAYEAGDISTEQARAFGATGDKALQAQCFEALGKGPALARTPAAIRAWYRIGDQEAEKLLRFVGRDAYTAAGGWYEADLFDNGVDGSGRVADDQILRRLADAKVAALKIGIRERTGRDIRFIPQPPGGGYGGPQWRLHVAPTVEGDRDVLPEGDIVCSIAIGEDGSPEVDYWWASQKAMEGDRPKPAPATRRERVKPGAAIGRQYDDSRQKADAVIKEEAGLTQDGTQTLRSIRRAILRAALVQDAHEGRSLGRDYLVWAQLRMLLSTAGPYNMSEGTAEVGMRALASEDVDASGAAPHIRDSEAGRVWQKSVDGMRRQGFLTDTDLGRAFLAFRAAPAATKDLAAAIVAGLALERSLDADGYRIPVHDTVAAKAGLATPQGVRHWWKPTAAFLDLLPTAERAAIAEPFVEAATFASWTRVKSAELTPLVLGVVTGGAGATRRLQQIAASQWVHPLLAFRRETPIQDEQQLEAAE